MKSFLVRLEEDFSSVYAVIDLPDTPVPPVFTTSFKTDNFPLYTISLPPTLESFIRCGSPHLRFSFPEGSVISTLPSRNGDLPSSPFLESSCKIEISGRGKDLSHDGFFEGSRKKD